MLNDAGDRLFLGFGRDGLVLRPYRAGDEKHLVLREDFARAWAAIGQTVPPGAKWTLCADTRQERPLAIGGLEPDGQWDWGGWPNHLGAWALCSDMPPRAWAFARICAGAVLEFAGRRLAVQSVDATWPTARPAAGRLLKRLGFLGFGSTWRGPDGETYQPAVWRLQWIR